MADPSDVLRAEPPKAAPKLVINASQQFQA